MRELRGVWVAGGVPDMTSRPDTTNINVPPPRRRSSGALLAAAVIAVLALGALVVSALYATRSEQPAAASPSPTATAGETAAAATTTPTAATATPTAAAETAVGRPAMRTYESPLGYSVILPPDWRRSDIESRSTTDPQGDPELLGTDVFTKRTPADEEQARAATHVGFGPINEYTAYVRIYRNSEKLTTREFAEKERARLGPDAVSIEEITFTDRGRTSGGHPATRTTWRFPSTSDEFFATYVEDDQERMWVIGFYLAPKDVEPPAGASREDLLEIVGSFSAEWLRE
jgi:hypothetical protein